MTKRIRSVFVGLAALAALALGGSAIATAQSGTTHAAPASQGAQATGTSGNQTAPDPQGSSEAAGENSAKEQSNAAEQSNTAEQSSSAEQSGSESATNSDGPGGHADEPGNANADHQFQGQE